MSEISQVIPGPPHPHLLHLNCKMKCCKAILCCSPNASDISKLMSLVVAVMRAGHQSSLALHHPGVIQWAFTDTHFATKEDLRL